MDWKNQDADGYDVRSHAGELAFTDEDTVKVWAEHHARLLNGEFQWPSEKLPEISPTASFHPSLSATLIVAS